MWSQSDVIFPVHAVAPAGRLPAGAEPLELASADGDRLVGIHLRPAGAEQGASTLILGFGGNAWNAQHVAEYLHDAFPDAHVIVFHYRGYRPSGGAPSARALLADAPLIHDFAIDRLRPERVVAVGFSIGSGVAAGLAQERKLDGLILVTPFDSLKAVAAGLYPWLPIAPFFEHEMNSAELLEGSQVPVAILAAERDEIVFAVRTEALRRQVTNLAFDRTIPGSGHNDIYGRSDFQAALREALTAVTRNDSGDGKP